MTMHIYSHDRRRSFTTPLSYEALNEAVTLSFKAPCANPFDALLYAVRLLYGAQAVKQALRPAPDLERDAWRLTAKRLLEPLTPAPLKAPNQAQGPFAPLHLQ